MIEVWLDDANGNRLESTARAISAEVLHVPNDYGVIAVELPADYDRYIDLDRIVEVWLDGRFEAAGFMRRWLYYDDSDGAEITRVIAYTGNYLLTSRIIAYPAGALQADKTDYADDMLKEIISEQLGGDAIAARDLSGLSVTVQADLSDAPSISKAFAWRPLLNVCKDISAASEEAGTALYFDFVPYFVSASRIGWDFRTYTGQRGSDHGSTSGQPLFFGKNWGNLNGPQAERDHTEEATYVFAGGQGEGALREIVQVSDTDRMNATIWNRREAFADARNETTTAGVTDKGRQALFDRRPVRRFSGEIAETQGRLYGLDWGFGDRVVVEYRGQIYDARIDTVSLRVASSGQRQITGRFKVEE